jgi:hypothetical protein
MEQVDQKDGDIERKKDAIHELEERAYDAHIERMEDGAVGWYEKAGQKRKDEEALLMAANHLDGGDSIEQVQKRFKAVLDVLGRYGSQD